MATGMMIAKNEIRNVSHWSLENGYGNEIMDDEYPMRVADAGRKVALEIDLVLDEPDNNRKCQNVHRGFYVSLTIPVEPFHLKLNLFKSSMTEDTHIQVSSKMVTTSDGLRNYSPRQRQCFYQSERQLRFFKTYTEQNCKSECVANFMKRQCGCVHLYMPSKYEL